MELDSVVLPGEVVDPSSCSTAARYRDKTCCRAAIATLANVSTTESEIEGKGRSRVPTVGETVLAKLTKTTAAAAYTDILCIAGTPVESTFNGIIRSQDARLEAVVNLHECFRPGDVVVAEVTSLGTSRMYYLSTARSEHGVISARSAAGHGLFAHPIKGPHEYYVV